VSRKAGRVETFAVSGGILLEKRQGSQSQNLKQKHPGNGRCLGKKKLLPLVSQEDQKNRRGKRDKNNFPAQQEKMRKVVRIRKGM